MDAATELGAFLRARRARVQPDHVGLPTGPGPRRTPGLRREELAALAGVSIDYYIRLEQGKETGPSGAVLAALAAALHLDQDATAHLYALANHAARRTPPLPPTIGSLNGSPVRPGLLLLLETLRPCPAYLLSPISDVLAANPEGLALFDGLADWPEARRNTIRYTFLHPAAPELFGRWDQAATACVANLRSLLGGQPDSEELAALVAELDARSPTFRALWGRYDVERRRSSTKSFHHRTVGDLTLQHEVLRVDGGRRLSIYQAPPATNDHDALVLLAMSAEASS